MLQRMYLALEAIADDHREHGSAGEGSMWARLAVYVEAVLRSLYIEISMQVTTLNLCSVYICILCSVSLKLLSGLKTLLSDEHSGK